MNQFNDEHTFRHDSNDCDCNSHRQNHHDRHGDDHHHFEMNHCPHCHNHHNHYGLCEHPIIFDKRFIVDEHYLNHHMTSFNHNSYDHHNDEHCDQCNNHSHHDDCECCDHNCYDHRFLCDDRFRVRLAGIDGRMSYRLRQLMDCEVRLDIESEGSSSQFSGSICYVGSDFIEFQLSKSKKTKKIKTNSLRRKRVKASCKKEEFKLIPFDSIKAVSISE